MQGPRKCDVCGKEKPKTGNHWFIAWVQKWPNGDEIQTSLFCCVAWSLKKLEQLQNDKPVELCGSSCAQKQFEKFLSSTQ
jgi:hypothetical protein